jgi:hypothetical protein
LCYNGKVIIKDKPMDWIFWAIGGSAFFLAEFLKKRHINYKIF